MTTITIVKTPDGKFEGLGEKDKFAYHKLCKRQNQFRFWVEVGAGHCEFVPGPSGRMVAIAKSIAWHRLDEAEFEIHHRKVIDFIRSDHFQRFLWPHLAPAQTHETVETILGQLERA